MATITFNEIPVNLRHPGAYTEYDSSRAVQGLSALPARGLIVGNMLSHGTASGSIAYQVTSANQANTLFGTGSQAAHMVQSFKKANTLDELWVIGLDDNGAGSNSTWNLNFSGSAATADGTVHLLLGGRKVDVAVSSGDTASDISSAVATAMEGEDLAFTYTATDISGTLTSRHAAAFTADLDVRHSYFDRQELPAGVTLSITQTQAGTGNPDVQDAIDNIPDEWMTHFIMGYNDSSNMTAAETHAETQWGPTIQRDEMIFVGVEGNYSTASTFGAGRNSKFSTAIACGQSPTPDYEWAASYGAVDLKEPDPARPRQYLKLPGILPPARSDRFTFSERNLLLNGGVSIHLVDQGNNVSIGRAITTYQTNAAGGDDPTYLDTTTLFTLAALRYTLNQRIQLKFPRHKLTSDGTLVPPGQPMVSPSVIRGEILALYDLWADVGWVEAAAKSQFAAELLVERNSSDVNRVDAILPPDLINQFVVFAGQIQFLL